MSMKMSALAIRDIAPLDTLTDAQREHGKAWIKALCDGTHAQAVGVLKTYIPEPIADIVTSCDGTMECCLGVAVSIAPIGERPLWYKPDDGEVADSGGNVPRYLKLTDDTLERLRETPRKHPFEWIADERFVADNDTSAFPPSSFMLDYYGISEDLQAALAKANDVGATFKEIAGVLAYLYGLPATFAGAMPFDPSAVSDDDDYDDDYDDYPRHDEGGGEEDF